MTKKTRTILFSVVVVLFFLSSLTAIFYSQGYRFDFERKKVTQTGALSFKVEPPGASVYIDGKLAKKTNFLFGTVYIDNLLPKKYVVEIQKKGFLPWKKSLEVKEEWAIENKNIFLVPENPQFNLLEKGVDNFFFSPDGKKAILLKTDKEGWILTFFNLEKNNPSLLFKEKDFSEKGEEVDFLGLEWSEDSKKLLLRTKIKENKYFIIEIGEKPTLYSLNSLKDNITQMTFNPRDSQKIFFTQSLKEGNSLFFIDYKSEKISDPILNDFLTFQASSDSLFWLDDQGFLHQSDVYGREIRQFNRETISLKPNSQYQLFPFAEDKIFLKEDDRLYFLNQEGQSFEKILDGVKEVKISPDLKKMVYFTNYEIWILFLEKIEDQPQKEEGEKLFLTRFSEKIENLFWWTSHYLIFNAGSIIKIAEIDDRDKINIYDLAEFPNPKIFWGNLNKKLYLLTEGGFYSSEKLIP